jgi:predicted secreted protein
MDRQEAGGGRPPDPGLNAVKFQSILAIYILFWTLSLFLVLPFGVRTPEEEGEETPAGHAPSAPHRFSLGTAALRATIVSAVAFGLFYANYLFGWVTVDMLDWAR